MTVIAMTGQLGCLGTEVANVIAVRLGLKINHSDLPRSLIVSAMTNGRKTKAGSK